MNINSAELLFVKSVKDGIPNRDPLNDSDARRLFGEDDGRISLSDVSIKRDVRDYVLAKYPEGGDQKRYFVFCRQERTDDGKLLGREGLAKETLKKANFSGDVEREPLLKAGYDVRLFGAVYSVKNGSFNQTGPVQFGWAHSLHPVESKYVQGTVVMPSQGEGKSQGTIWTTYIVPFAVFAMPAVINATIARDTGLDEIDVDLLLESLWQGTKHRQARGRGFQQPLFLMHIEYNDPFFRVGYLEDHIKLEPAREVWQGGNPPTSVSEIALNVESLVGVLTKYNNKISRIRYWAAPELKIEGELPGEKCFVW